MFNTLEIDSVIKSFGERQILTDVYLQCKTGEIIGVLGRNGCGKSTLLKIIFGSAQSNNKSIRINDKVYTNPYQTRNLIAYLPQHGFLPENISVKGIVNLYIVSRENRRKILRDERIVQHKKKKVTALSSGELRYFEILLLLNLDAKFILLDEPFSGIEPLYKEKVKSLIKEYKKYKGFITTDHDYRNIIDVSDKIMLITNGACKNITNVIQLEELNYLPAGTLSQQTTEYDTEPVVFDIDKQTLQDLELVDSNKEGAVYSIFNRVKTVGGKNKLGDILRHPLTNIHQLECRRNTIQFFSNHLINLSLNKDKIDFIEHYLSSNFRLFSKNFLDILVQSLLNKIKPGNDYYIVETGIIYIFDLIGYLSHLIVEFQTLKMPGCLSNIVFNIQDIISIREFQEIIYSGNQKRISAFCIAKYDHFFRKNSKEKLRAILDFLYELDVFESVANIARTYNFSFPEYLPSGTSTIQLQGLFHPLLTQPVENDFSINNSNNLCVVTGANMSGKSTFLKSFGLAIYLAHIGFPVPARKMETSVFNGLITTINLSDNIKLGYSHFYSEVKRVKETALKIRAKKKIIVIFDELFRGTNVKDAADASLMVTSAFSRIRDSIFLISTHIVEITEDLKKNNNIFFRCFESKLEGEIPIYNYKLKTGVSAERLGMLIIKNEKIIEILEELIKEDESQGF